MHQHLTKSILCKLGIQILHQTQKNYAFKGNIHISFKPTMTIMTKKIPILHKILQKV